MTAQEFYNKYDSNGLPMSFNEKMIEFAKYHVEQALKEASEKASLYKFNDSWKVTKQNIKVEKSFNYSVGIDKETILNAYPSTNIK